MDALIGYPRAMRSSPPAWLLSLLTPGLLLALTSTARAQSLVKMSEQDAYALVFATFAEGRQRDAEVLARERLRRFPEERRLLFLSATFERSRFNKSTAGRLYQKVVALDPQPDALDALSRAGRIVIELDRAEDVGENFDALMRLSEAEPHEPLWLWLIGIQSREHEFNARGARAYERLLELVDPGGVMIHQTYANLLDQLKRYDEALPHRELAVKLEEARWTYNGLGNTLRMLERHQEACEAYANADRFTPGHGRNLAQWAMSELALGRFESAAGRFERAVDGGFRESWVYSNWASAALATSGTARAIEIIEAGLKVHPESKLLKRRLRELEGDGEL